MARGTRRWKSFKEFVRADLNSESLYEGTLFMTLAGALSTAVGYQLGSILLEASGAIFLMLAAGFFLFLLRWYFQPSP